MDEYDVAIVGGGIIGLATAHALSAREPRPRIIVVEKERRFSAHQSGRNSGVLHSGIYYKPGSFKARLAVAGRASMTRFCDEHGVPFETCGKVIVATDELELDRLDELQSRAEQNGVIARPIGPEELRELEPYAVGKRALHVPETGVVDFGRVSATLASLIHDAGTETRLEWPVTAIHEEPDRVRVESPRGLLTARCLVNCAGLFSDKLAHGATNRRPDVRIVPFRGEFHELVPGREHLVQNLIYPVPDPAFPFLGVHLTRGINGRVHAGPNAVLALAREGYSWGQLDPRELRELAQFPGFRTLAARYWRTGGTELYQSLSKRALARALRRLVPSIQAADLVRTPAGVRAQALRVDGSLVDDFVIDETKRMVHVVNAPSPAATAALEIGKLIAERVGGHLV